MAYYNSMSKTTQERQNKDYYTLYKKCEMKYSNLKKRTSVLEDKLQEVFDELTKLKDKIKQHNYLELLL